jgi:hypothetical protein
MTRLHSASVKVTFSVAFDVAVGVGCADGPATLLQANVTIVNVISTTIGNRFIAPFILTPIRIIASRKLPMSLRA